MQLYLSKWKVKVGSVRLFIGSPGMSAMVDMLQVSAVAAAAAARKQEWVGKSTESWSTCKHRTRELPSKERGRLHSGSEDRDISRVVVALKSDTIVPTAAGLVILPLQRRELVLEISLATAPKNGPDKQTVTVVTWPHGELRGHEVR